MNRFYAEALILTVLIVIGIFQVFRGISSIRLRNESTLFGWIRIVLGLILALVIPAVLLYFLRETGK